VGVKSLVGVKSMVGRKGVYWGCGGHHMCKWIYLHSRTTPELWILRMPSHPQDSLWLICYGFFNSPLFFDLGRGGERLPFEEHALNEYALCLFWYLMQWAFRGSKDG